MATRQNEQAASTSNAVTVFRKDLSAMESQFGKMLPSHITPDRFARVLMNAVNATPRLMLCDRQSLWNAAMQAAEDGLLPDKREGAIVPFKKGKEDEGGSVGNAGDYVATWIPMVLGVRKVIRQSGEIRDLNVQLVYVDEQAAGKFIHELGDSPMLKHQRLPPPGDPASRAVYCGYSLAWDKSGNLFVPEVMFEAELMAVARRSKSFKHGPWSDPLFAHEMRKKTVTKRHFKQLPTSRDLDRVLSRDDSLFDFGRDKAEGAKPPQVSTIRGGAADQLQHFARTPMEVVTPRDEPETVDRGETQETGEPERQQATAGQDGAKKTAAKTKPEEDPNDSANAKTPEQYAERLRAYLATAKSADAIKAKWKREMQVRNGVQLTPEFRDELDAECKAAIGRLEGDAS